MQSQFSTSSVNNRNIQHGDTVGANPAQAPKVINGTFINDNNPSQDQETMRGIFWRPTQNQESTHFPENDHALYLPSSRANRNSHRQEGIINYLIHQGLLNPDLQLTIPSPEIRDFITHAKNINPPRSTSTETEPKRFIADSNHGILQDEILHNNQETRNRNFHHTLNAENTTRYSQAPRNPQNQPTHENDDIIQVDTLRRLGSLMDEEQSSGTHNVTSSEFRNAIDRIQ